MKRSEALDIIWTAINELEDGNYILTKLEEAGMLPPDTGMGCPIQIITPTNNIEYVISKDHRWEPETEANV